MNILAIIKCAVMNMGVQVDFSYNFFPLDVYIELKLLHHMVFIYLNSI